VKLKNWNKFDLFAGGGVKIDFFVIILFGWECIENITNTTYM
jgi:hypothetical protein